ncbi:condensation domain-containing protein [Dactylosporangium sp. CA-139066]|uniref:condensation domain-containing protein n=1 Tax=Dactylosporangium sp. CA-139066 TaxID=3239930 RepID=UPI003D8F1A23
MSTETFAATPTVTAPVSYCQESFLAADESAVNVPSVVALPGPVAVDRVRGLLDELVARHGALRTELTSEAGPGSPPGQRVAGTGRLDLVYERHDGSVRELLPRWLLAGSERPFRLLDGPLARAELHAAGARHVLVLWLHHAISDLSTSQVLADEAARLWRGERLPRPVTHMADFARQERAVRPTAAQWRYWEQTLSGADDTFGLPYPAAGAAHLMDRPALPVLPAGVVTALQRLAATARTTMTAVLAAASVAAHLDTAREERVVIGLTVGNRDQPHLRSVVGCLADQLPLVVDIAGRPTFRGLVGRVREALLDAYEHRLPLGRLVELLGRRPAPLFAVNLNFLPPARPAAAGATPAAADEDLLLPYGIAKSRPDAWWLGDATLAYRPRIDRGLLAGEVEGDGHLHGSAQVRRWAERFSGVLERAAREPDRDVAALVAGL